MEGLGGGNKSPSAGAHADVPPEAAEAMQRSALTEIAAKAGRRIPIVRGRDKGLPKAPPILDVEAMRAKNEATAVRLTKGSASV